MSQVLTHIRRGVIALLTLALVAGCGGAKPATQPGGGESKPASQPAADAAAKKDKYVIGVALASATQQFYVAMRKGVEAKAKELGNVELRIVQAEEDPVKQLNGIQDLVAQKVDGILVSPIDAQAAIPAYEAARAAKIPIFSIARAVDPKYQDAFVGADWTKYGRIIAEAHVKALNGKGNIAMVKGPAGASFVQEMEKGFKEVVAKNPGVKIVAEGNSNLTADDAGRLAADLLTAHKDINAIFVQTDGQVPGVIKALEDRQLIGKVFVSGFDGTPDEVNFIKAGKLGFTVALKPTSWGAKGLEALVNHLKGTKAPTLVEIDTLNIDKSNVEKITLKDIE